MYRGSLEEVHRCIHRIIGECPLCTFETDTAKSVKVRGSFPLAGASGFELL